MEKLYWYDVKKTGDIKIKDEDMKEVKHYMSENIQLYYDEESLRVFTEDGDYIADIEYISNIDHIANEKKKFKEVSKEDIEGLLKSIKIMKNYIIDGETVKAFTMLTKLEVSLEKNLEEES